MIQKLPVQYELTLMPPAMMGREYVKTFGHRHIAEPRSGIDYTEVCRVEYGTAHFLLHDLDLDRDAPSSGVAYLIEAKAGDTILLPPGYDHLTINPGPGPMLFSDVIARGVYGIYDRFRVTRGACLLEVESGGSPTFIPNPTYSNVPSLQRIPMCEYPKLQLGRDIPLYQALCETKGDIWEFLLDPTLFWPCFPDLKAAMGIQ